MISYIFCTEKVSGLKHKVGSLLCGGALLVLVEIFPVVSRRKLYLLCLNLNLPVCILICLVSSSLRENLLSHSLTGQAYGLSWTGVLLGLFGYFLALTGIRLMGMLAV